MVIKVADFGLVVNTGDKDYYRLSSNDMDIKLPVMWMAPESLSTRVFSEKSDIVRKQYSSNDDLNSLRHFACYSGAME